MKDENRAIIGRNCIVKVVGECRRGEVVDVVESIAKPYDIILYCVRLDKRIYLQFNYDVGVDTLEKIEFE